MKPTRAFTAPILRWLKAHGHHLLFAATLLSLAALCGWWAIFIRRAIVQEGRFRSESLRNSVALHAVTVGHTPGVPPAQGVFAADPRLEITSSPAVDRAYVRSLEPYWPELYLQARGEVIGGLEAKSGSRAVMVVGESSLLVLLLLGSTFMLYRLIWAERRTATELQELWSRVTHEIKTPIAGLKAFLQTLRDRDLSREELRSCAAMALRQVERQQQLAENILVGRRLGRSGGRFNLSRVDLVEFCRRFAEEHQFILAGKEIRFDFNGYESLDVEVDPDALRVILLNLLDNAVKYGAKKVDLEIDADARHARALLKDDGPGFPPQAAHDLFSAYRRLASELPDGKQGTGMGLHISRRLARRMRGDLTAHSEGPGRGARFRLILPRARRGR